MRGEKDETQQIVFPAGLDFIGQHGAGGLPTGGD
jgi:hypothetical protein